MKEIKAMPLYVHLDDGFIFICLRNGTYIIYNKDLDSIYVDNAKLIFSSYRLRENKIMFGFEDGNAMILTINQEGITQTVEMDDINWRKNNGFHFEHSRIICMGQANNRHYAFSKDGLVQQFNQMTPQNNTQIQWDFLIHKIHITQTAIFICQETRFCALPITYNLETFNLKTFNFLSSQQIFIDGTSIDKIEQHPKFCETLKMHNGIQFIDSTHDQLFILLKDGNLIIYTYGPFKDGIKVNLIKRLKFEFINPIGFNLANANQVMVAFKHKRMYFDYENLTIQQQYELPFKLKGSFQFYRSYDLIWGGRQLHLNFYRSNCLAKDGCFELVEYI